MQDESDTNINDETDEEAHPLFTPKRKIKFLHSKDSAQLERKPTPGYIGVDSLQYFQRKY